MTRKVYNMSETLSQVFWTKREASRLFERGGPGNQVADGRLLTKVALVRFGLKMALSRAARPESATCTYNTKDT